jgi:hypothetical protein
MADPILFVSSCFHGIIIAILLLFAFIYKRLPKYIIALLSIVILTSILNHAYSNNTYKWCDRLAVVITIIALCIYILCSKYSILSKYIIFFAVLLITVFYICAKYSKHTNRNDYILFHYGAHIVGTFLIAFIIIAM